MTRWARPRDVETVTDRRSSLTFSGAGLQLWEVDCRAPRSGPTPEEYVATAQFVLPQRGVFRVHRLAASAVAAAPTAVLLAPGETYRVSHPVSGGDECLVLAVTPEVVDDVVPVERSRHLTLSPATQLGVRLFARGVRGRDFDPLDGEVTGLALLAALACDLRQTPESARPLSTAARRRAIRAQALLAADPTRPWRLESMAAAVGCSR